MWCRDVTEILESNEDRLQGMKDFEQKSFRELNELAALVRGVCPAFTNYCNERKWMSATYVYMSILLSQSTKSCYDSIILTYLGFILYSLAICVHDAVLLISMSIITVRLHPTP